MARVTVTVTGADRLARKLRGLGRDLTEMDLTTEGRQVARRAGQEAPKRTGALSRAPEVQAPQRGHARVTLGRRRYGPPVHSGVPSRGIDPDEYLYRASRRERHGVVRSVRRKVSGLIRSRRL